jgi:hypothetical protein
MPPKPLLFSGVESCSSSLGLSWGPLIRANLLFLQLASFLLRAWVFEAGKVTKQQFFSVHARFWLSFIEFVVPYFVRMVEASLILESSDSNVLSFSSFFYRICVVDFW